jgi:AcrR family transcriptional regulator
MPRSAKSATKPRRRPAKRPPALKPYHHGDLRRVLIDAALKLVEEGGAEAVSVREAARRAGVSPGAPFRHFASRSQLIAAVAAEAQRRSNRRRPAIRWRGFAPSAPPICAGRCATRRISRSSQMAGILRMTPPRRSAATMPRSSP